MRPDPSAKINRKHDAVCAATQSRLLDYLDGTLTANERAKMQAHLELCANCREALAQQTASESALSSARFAIPPAGDLRSDFYARLASESPRRSPFHVRRGWIAAVPMAAAGLLALTFIRSNAPVSQTIERPMRQIASAKNIVPIVPQRTRPTLRKSDRNEIEIASADGPEPTFREVTRRSFATASAPAPVVRTERPPVVAVQHFGAVTAFRARKAAASANYKREDFALKSPEMLADATSLAAQSPDVKLDKSFASVPKPDVKLFAGVRMPDVAQFSNRHGSEFDKSMALAEKEKAADARKDAAKSVSGDVLALSAGISPQADRDEAAPDMVDLQVSDKERGFECSTRIAGTVEEKSEGEILTIEAESSDET